MVLEPGGNDDDDLEFATQLRGHEVSCWLRDGHLHGDPELIRRLKRFAAQDFQFEPLSLARRMRDAIGSNVKVRLRTPQFPETGQRSKDPTRAAPFAARPR